MKISEALALAAQEAGMRDVEIAAATGVSQTTVSRWRTGANEPRGAQLMLLRKLLPKFARLLDGKAA